MCYNAVGENLNPPPVSFTEVDSIFLKLEITRVALDCKYSQMDLLNLKKKKGKKGNFFAFTVCIWR